MESARALSQNKISIKVEMVLKISIKVALKVEKVLWRVLAPIEEVLNVNKVREVLIKIEVVKKVE